MTVHSLLRSLLAAWALVAFVLAGAGVSRAFAQGAGTDAVVSAFQAAAPAGLVDSARTGPTPAVRAASTGRVAALSRSGGIRPHRQKRGARLTT